MKLLAELKTLVKNRIGFVVNLLAWITFIAGVFIFFINAGWSINVGFWDRFMWIFHDNIFHYGKRFINLIWLEIEFQQGLPIIIGSGIWGCGIGFIASIIGIYAGYTNDYAIFKKLFFVQAILVSLS